MYTNVMIMLGACMAVFSQYVAALTTVHVVGDGHGWVIPQGGGGALYGNWATSKKFVVGDILVFNFTTTRHDVVEVPKPSYDACTSTDLIGAIISTSPVNITLSSPGDHYYICTFNDHCNLGQKLSITVSDTPDNALPPSATPTTQFPSPPTTTMDSTIQMVMYRLPPTQLPSPPTTTTDSTIQMVGFRPRSIPHDNNLGDGKLQVLHIFAGVCIFIRLMCFLGRCVDTEERVNEAPEFYQDTYLTIHIIE